MPGATDGALEPVGHRWRRCLPLRWGARAARRGSVPPGVAVSAARCGGQCRTMWRVAHDVTPVARVSLFARTLWSVQRRARHEAL